MASRKTAQPTTIHREDNHRLPSEDAVLAATDMKLGPKGFVPTTLLQAQQVARLYVESGLAPKTKVKGGGYLPIDEQIAQATIAIELGMAVGLSCSQSVQSIAVINGRPTIWGDALIALVHASGLLESIDTFTEGTKETAKIVVVVRRLGTVGEFRGEFGYRDAVRANLWNKEGPWKQYPARMMQMRARSFALRDAFADILKGIVSREEFDESDYDDAGNEIHRPLPKVKRSDANDRLGAAMDLPPAEPAKPVVPREPGDDEPGMEGGGEYAESLKQESLDLGEGGTP